MNCAALWPSVSKKAARRPTFEPGRRDDLKATARVVVIGGSGHVGTYLVPRLVREVAGAPAKLPV